MGLFSENCEGTAGADSYCGLWVKENEEYLKNPLLRMRGKNYPTWQSGNLAGYG